MMTSTTKKNMLPPKSTDKAKILQYIVEANKPEYLSQVSYQAMSGFINEVKNTLWEMVEDGNKEQIVRLLQQLLDYENDGEVLKALNGFGMLGVWFVAYKKNAGVELLRFYELNLFLYESYANIRGELVATAAAAEAIVGKKVPWITTTLTKVYDDILVKKLDPTIFYSKAFVESHFMGHVDSATAKQQPLQKKDLSVSEFFKRSKTLDGTLYHYLQRTLNPHKNAKDQEHMDKLIVGDTLSYHYENSEADDVGDIIRYRGNSDRSSYNRIIDLKARLFVLRLMQEAFLFVRHYFIDTTYDVRAERDVMKLFDGIATYLTNQTTGERDSRDRLIEMLVFFMSISIFTTKTDPVPLKQKLNRIGAEIDGLYSEFDDNDLILSVLFKEEEHDRDLKMNRDKYRWLLPFNREKFTNNLPEEARSRDEILIEEARLWINLLHLNLSKEGGQKRKRSTRVQVIQQKNNTIKENPIVPIDLALEEEEEEKKKKEEEEERIMKEAAAAAKKEEERRKDISTKSKKKTLKELSDAKNPKSSSSSSKSSSVEEERREDKKKVKKQKTLLEKEQEKRENEKIEKKKAKKNEKKRAAEKEAREKDDNTKKKRVQTLINIGQNGATLLQVTAGMARLIIGKEFDNKVVYEVESGDRVIEIPVGTHYMIEDCYNNSSTSYDDYSSSSSSDSESFSQ